MSGSGEKYGVFSDDGSGPLWKAFIDDLEDARAKAQRIAVDEGVEVFVFSFYDYSEVARFFPKRKAAAAGAGLA
jgi:hypothetical protein